MMTTAAPFAADQASVLRDLVSERGRMIHPDISGMKTLAIISGKGGVGKSSLAANLSLALAELDLNVVLMDADLGLASVDVLFGISPRYDLGNVLRGERSMAEVAIQISRNLTIIPGGAGTPELADLDEQTQRRLLGSLALIADDIDVAILDTGAGIHRSVISFALASDISLLMTTPEPTAVRDAYGVLKSLCRSSGGEIEAGIVVNMATDENEAASVAMRIASAAAQFLRYRVPYWGCIPWNQRIRDSVKLRRPIMLDRTADASAGPYRALARRLAAMIREDDAESLRTSDGGL